MQFWDHLDRLPEDVRECMESWRGLERQGFELLLFDDEGARDFIARSLGSRYARAYDRCYHPAMQSDYFRLCYVLMEGGCYLDADDVFLGSPLSGQLAGKWSRRIDQEHRLVYAVEGKRIYFLAARHHY